MAIPMQGGNYNGKGVKLLSDPWHGHDLKKDFFS